MKKILLIMGVFILIIYCCFAILPEYLKISLPTGGEDWLNFIGIIASMVIAAWGVIETIKKTADVSKEQAIMAVKPCLDIVFLSRDSVPLNAIGIYRKLCIDGQKIYNNGYTLIQQGQPKDFKPNVIISVRNIGLSPALNTNTTFHNLLSVADIDNFNDIQLTNIENFYDKIRFNHKISYIEKDQKKEAPFYLAPPYNLNNNDDRFYMIFDVTNVKNPNHLIFRFRFEDVYGTAYIQYLYFFIDRKDFSFLPISNILSSKQEKGR